MTPSEQLFDEIAGQLSRIYGAEPGKMFGKKCIKINTKAFSCFFMEDMVFKLGKEEVDILLQTLKDTQLFDPSGKQMPMKEWIQIPFAYKNDWLTFAEKSLRFVSKA